MTPAQIAEILPGLRLHAGAGAIVVHARPDETDRRLILEIDEDGARRDWELAVDRLIDQAGGADDETRLRAAVVTLYAEDTEPDERWWVRTRTLRPDDPSRATGRDLRPYPSPSPPHHQRETFYEGPARGGGSVSPGPGDPKLDL